jgi:autophagy-related protein 16-1
MIMYAADNRLLAREKSLQLENVGLSQRVTELSRAVTESGAASPQQSQNSTADEAPSASSSLNPEKEQELYQTYKKLADLQDELRGAHGALKAAQEATAAKHDELSRIQHSLESSQRVVRDRDEEIQGLNLTIGILKEELQELQVVLVTNDEKVKELTREKNELVNELMKKAQQNADLANKLLDLQTKLNSLPPELQQAQQAAQNAANASGGSESSAAVQRPLPSRARRILTQHAGEVNCVSYNVYGTTLGSGGLDKVVRLWDTNQFAQRSSLQGAIQSVMALDFSNDDQFVLAASNDNTCRVWHQATQRVRHTLNGHTSKIYGAVFSFDSHKVVTGSHDRTIKVWDLAKGYCIRTIFCYSSCNSVCLNPEASMIVSGHVDTTVRVWDMKNGDCVFDLSGVHSGQVTGVSMAPDSLGQCILTNSKDNSLKLIDLRTHEVLQTFKHANYKNSVNWARGVFSPDGTHVAVGSAEGSVFIWERASGKLHSQLKGGHKAAVTSIAWNPINVQQLASADTSGTIVVWD